jgi:hypothetical protein
MPIPTSSIAVAVSAAAIVAGFAAEVNSVGSITAGLL